MNTLQLKNSIFKVFIELFIWNKHLRSRAKANWAKLHLKKYVNKAVQSTKVSESKTANSEKPIIWQYWHQGIKNAPLLIQKCVESVARHNPNCDIRVLSFDTINDYVKIPQKYYDLLEQKKIPIAIFSDILRLYLLTTYGGTWVDATLYFTDKIPDSVLNSEFFVLQKDPVTDAFGDKMSCYFIHSKQNSIWIHLIKNAIENYWAENDYLIHYFMFEHVVSMLSQATPELKAKWDEMEYYSTDNLGLLRKALYKDFSITEMKEIMNISYMHKLSYKILQDTSSGKSFYDEIINK